MRNCEPLRDFQKMCQVLLTISDIICYEVGRVFEQVLEDAGVFKIDKQGKEAFARFVEQLG